MALTAPSPMTGEADDDASPDGARHGSAAKTHMSLSTGADHSASRRTSASTTCGPPALVWSVAR